MYALSKDYGKLFDLLCAGNVAAGWVDYCNVRDIVKISRRKAFDVYIGVRGVCYTDLGAFDQEKGEERDIFTMRCQSVGLEWIEPAIPRATVADALAELRIEWAYQKAHYDNSQDDISWERGQELETRLRELDATIAKLGLAGETK